jgi:MOSC domain-containing protein YiiM
MIAPGLVAAVAAAPRHGLAKMPQGAVTLLPGLGVHGDAHCGALVRHRFLARRDPSQPNLRQVHLIQAELHDALRRAGFDAASGTLGENILTRGIDLAALPARSRLRLGEMAVVEITGLRYPCRLLDRQQAGLMAAVTARNDAGLVFFRMAAMAVVVSGGDVRPDDMIAVALPGGKHQPLGLV